MTQIDYFRQPRRSALSRWLVAGCLLLALGCYGGPWPDSSDLPLHPIPNPQLPGEETGLPFRFAVFGDQRALADGEWQRLIQRVDILSQEDPDLLFVIDTGDIVQNGSHRDQFSMHREVLSRLTDTLPYWVTVGNHEVNNNRKPMARESLAAFLSTMDTVLNPDRLYYKKTVGGVRFLFLDSNDMVYWATPAEEAKRAERLEQQMAWLVNELSAPDAKTPTIVGMHHPLMQTSSKHFDIARDLWGLSYRDRALPDILLDGGVDLILTGHTHTYERFRISRRDGAKLHLINLSGRPKNSLLMFGAGQRRAKDISGEEMKWLTDRGWTGLDGYVVEQLDAMVDPEANQFGVITVTDAGLELEVYFDEEEGSEWRRTGNTPLN